MSVFFVINTIVFIAIATKLYAKYTNNFCTSTKKLDGRTCVITGGTAGIGLEIAKQLARRNARVIIASSSAEKGNNAERIIKEETQNQNVVFKQLNLADLSSVRSFAEDVLQNEKRLDILINNAGVGLPNRELNDDGVSFVMQVNYFGHFLLTLLLLPLLRKTGNPTEKSRIVNTGSNMYKLVPFGVKEIQRPKNIILYGYCLSKLCLIHFTKELSRKMENFDVVVNCVHPGIIATEIHTNFVIYYFSKMFKTIFEGVQTSLYAALDTEAGQMSGKYFDNCKVVKEWPWACNVKEAKEVWDKSVELVQISENELKASLK